MKVCLYGAGAIGGLMGVRLANAGAEVSVVEVGAPLEAIKANGLKVISGGQTFSAPVKASSEPAELGPQDLIIVAVKGPTLKFVAQKIGALIGPNTVIMTAMNGVPWWFFEGFGGSLAGTQLKTIDPDGSIGKGVPANRVIGCVINLSCALAEIGVVQHVGGNKLTIGEPNNTVSDRVKNLGETLTKAGFDVTVTPSIQSDIWFKLFGNMTHNPISAITGATTDRIINDPLTADFCCKIMTEAGEIGKKIGCIVTETPQQRNAHTLELGAFKTSMLQDVEAKKALEIDGLVSSVREIGQLVGVPTPYTDVLLGLVRVKGQVMGIYPQNK